MKQKQIYECPDTQLLFVKFEENIMSPNDGYHPGGGGTYGEDDQNDNGDY